MTTHPHASLSRREREIMDVVHRRGSATVAEVMEEMAEPPSYSAVRATLRVLEEKGHVRHREDGPRYTYEPMVGAEEAREAALAHVVRTFFDGSVDLTVAALLRLPDTDLEEADVRRLATEIERARKEGR